MQIVVGSIYKTALRAVREINITTPSVKQKRYTKDMNKARTFCPVASDRLSYARATFN